MKTIALLFLTCALTLTTASTTNAVEETRGTGTLELGLAVPNVLQIADGSPASPVTTTNASVVISRRENLTSPTAENTALFLINNSTGTTQPTALNAYSFQLGNGDSCAVFAVAKNFGLGIHSAIGGFFLAETNNADGNNTTGAIAIETQTTNWSGVDRPYVPTVGGVAVATGLDLVYSGNGNLGGAAVAIRSSADSRWDVGIGFMQGDFIKTASIQDNTDSHTILKAASGSHAYGIDLSGATYSGAAIKLSANATITEGGITINASDTGIDFGYGTTINRVSNDGHLRLTSQNGITEIVGALQVDSITQDAVTAVSIFSNGWENSGGSHAPTGYYKDRSGRVWLQGAVKSCTTARTTAMWVLPTGYRPSHIHSFAVSSFNGISDILGIVEITPGGEVRFITGSNTFLSLAGISFRPD